MMEVTNFCKERNENGKYLCGVITWRDCFYYINGNKRGTNDCAYHEVDADGDSLCNNRQAQLDVWGIK
jgi:hypothetical protein